MLSLRPKSIRRRGRVANKKARLTGGRILLRLAIRLVKPFGPGMVAAYYLDKSAGGDRRKQALNRLGGVGRLRGGKKSA